MFVLYQRFFCRSKCPFFWTPCLHNCVTMVLSGLRVLASGVTRKLLLEKESYNFEENEKPDKGVSLSNFFVENGVSVLWKISQLVPSFAEIGGVLLAGQQRRSQRCKFSRSEKKFPVTIGNILLVHVVKRQENCLCLQFAWNKISLKDWNKYICQIVKNTLLFFRARKIIFYS